MMYVKCIRLIMMDYKKTVNEQLGKRQTAINRIMNHETDYADNLAEHSVKLRSESDNSKKEKDSVEKEAKDIHTLKYEDSNEDMKESIHVADVNKYIANVEEKLIGDNNGKDKGNTNSNVPKHKVGNKEILKYNKYIKESRHVPNNFNKKIANVEEKFGENNIHKDKENGKPYIPKDIVENKETLKYNKDVKESGHVLHSVNKYIANVEEKFGEDSIDKDKENTKTNAPKDINGDKENKMPNVGVNHHNFDILDIKEVKGVLRRSDIATNKTDYDNIKSDGKCWFLEKFKEKLLLGKIVRKKCSRRSNFDGKFVNVMTNVLNKYVDTIFRFTDEMTEILLENIFGRNVDLRNNIFDVNKLLYYLRKSVDRHRIHSHTHVITLQSKHCLTLSMPGCFCRPGFQCAVWQDKAPILQGEGFAQLWDNNRPLLCFRYVESSGQCVKPEDCITNENYMQYLSRIIVL